jgi:hypothetical protein
MLFVHAELHLSFLNSLPNTPSVLSTARQLITANRNKQQVQAVCSSGCVNPLASQHHP